MKNINIDHKFVYQLQKDVSELNSSNLSLFDFLKQNKKTNLFIFKNTDSFCIIDSSFVFSEFYNYLFTNSKKISFFLTLTRTNKLYELKFQKASVRALKILNNHKLEFLKINLLKNPFIFNFFKNKDVYSSSITKINEFTHNIKYILSVTKNKKISDYYYCNKNLYSENEFLSFLYDNFISKIEDDKNATIVDLMNLIYNLSGRTHSVFSFVNLVAKNIKLNILLNKKDTKKLLNKKTYSLIYSFYNDDIFTTFKESFLHRISKFENSNILEDQIKIFIEKNLNWNIDLFEKKLKKDNIFYIRKNNRLIIHVQNFYESKKYGSPTWCISTSDQTFHSIVTKNYATQLFVFNFNINFSSNKSIIGITLENKKIKKIYNRVNNDVINDSNIYKESHLDSLLFFKNYRNKKILMFFKKIF